MQEEARYISLSLLACQEVILYSCEPGLAETVLWDSRDHDILRLLQVAVVLWQWLYGCGCGSVAVAVAQ